MDRPAKIFVVAALLFFAFLAADSHAQNAAPRPVIRTEGRDVIFHDRSRDGFITYDPELHVVTFLDRNGNVGGTFDLPDSNRYFSDPDVDSRGNVYVAYSPDETRLFVAKIGPDFGVKILDSSAVRGGSLTALVTERTPVVAVDSADNLHVAFLCETVRGSIAPEWRAPAGDKTLDAVVHAVTVRRYSPHGAITWTRTYNVPPFAGPDHIVFGPRDAIVIMAQRGTAFGGDITLHGIDGAGGRLRFQLTYITKCGGFQFFRMPRFSADGSIGIVGRSMIPGKDPLELGEWFTDLVLIDSSGRIVNTHCWPDDGPSVDFEILRRPRPGFHLIANEDEPAPANRATLLKLDGRGKIIATIPLHLGIEAKTGDMFVEGAAGELYFASVEKEGVVLSHVRPNGSLVWSRRYDLRDGDGGPLLYVQSIDLLPDGGFLVQIGSEAGESYLFRLEK